MTNESQMDSQTESNFETESYEVETHNTQSYEAESHDSDAHQPQAHVNAAPLEVEEAVTFASFKLPPALGLSLERMKYIHPTPVQVKAIPAAMEGKDVLGSAQTGTGKTGAFCIPLVAKMLREGNSKAIIMAPTRELASQTLVVLQQLLGNNRDIKTALLIGGESMGRQFDQLRNKPRIIVGTPGRINDHLRRAPSMLQGTDFVVLDEADRMLDMGFSVQIDTIIEKADPVHQTLMFSATFPDGILKFARQYLTDPVRISVNPKQVSAENIKHEVLHTTDSTKYDDLVQHLNDRTGTIIVFVKTKHGADRLAGRLEREDHDVGVIHGGLKQRQRDRAIQAFRDYKTRILVATDVAARGLDVPHIEHVINYDLPQNPEDYIHRIGRTARAGAEGNAIAFVLGCERGKWNAINRILNPGAKPEREERGTGGKRFEGKSGGGKFGDRKSGGFKKEGGFKKDYSRGDNSWNNTRNAGPRREVRAEKPADDFFGDEGNQIVQLRYAEGDVNRAPKRSYNERPRGERPYENRGGEREQSARPHSDRPRGDRPQGDRPYNNDRPRAERSFDKPRGDRPYGDRPQGDRPARAEGGAKPWENKRTERSDGFRKQRPDDGQVRADRPRGDRPQGDRPYNNDRPRGERTFGDKPRGDRPYNSDRPRGERTFGDKPRGDRPYNNDRPRGERTFGDKPRGDRPHNDRPQGDRDGNRPQRSEFRADRDGNRPQTERPDRDGNRPSNTGFKKDGFQKRSFGQKPGGGKPGGFKKPGGKREGGHRGSHRAA